MEKEIETQEAPLAPEFDVDVMKRIAAEATKQILEQEAPTTERKDPVLDTDKSDAKVTGERVPQWERRAFRAIHGILGTQSKDYQEVQKGKEVLQLRRFIAIEVRHLADFGQKTEGALIVALFAAGLCIGEMSVDTLSHCWCFVRRGRSTSACSPRSRVLGQHAHRKPA